MGSGDREDHRVSGRLAQAYHPRPSDGSVWSTGGLTRFDPKTEKFTHITEVPSAYGIAIDKQDTIWFTEMKPDRHGSARSIQRP